MKKYYFEIVISTAFALSTLQVTAQTADKPVLERYSSSSQTVKDMRSPELKKNAASAITKKSNIDSLQQVNSPQLKRADYYSGAKDKSENNNPK